MTSFSIGRARFITGLAALAGLSGLLSLTACNTDHLVDFAPCGRFYCEAEDQFAELATALNGEYHAIDDTTTAGDLVVRILETHLENGADVAFLIDRTGSMQDDIGAVKDVGGAIVELLGRHTDARLTVGFYRDRHYDGNQWYVMPPLSADHQAAVASLANVVADGGGDVRESVYDAIAKTLDELNWRSSSRKLLIVIGDAPSHTDSRSNHTLAGLQTKAAAKGVSFTIFPILSSPY